MNTQTTPVQVETPYGTLFVAVAAADRHSYYDMERGSVTELRPEVWVASNSDFQGDPGAEQHWTIRGRAYAVHYHMIREERRIGHWHKSFTPDAGGFRNDRRAPVEFGTPTWDKMWDALTTALDDFAARHPEWENISRYLRFHHDAESAADRAADARREAAKHDAEAEEHRSRAAHFASAVQGSSITLRG